MRQFVVCLVFLLAPICTAVGEVNLDVGSVNLPPGYVERRTGTKDSRMGEITSQNGVLVIHYDIGVMTGTHMHPKLESECLWYREQTINDRKIFSGIIAHNGTKQLIITIDEEKRKGAFQFPANFWAEIRHDEDVAEVMLIALSYSPHPGK